MKPKSMGTIFSVLAIITILVIAPSAFAASSPSSSTTTPPRGSSAPPSGSSAPSGSTSPPTGSTTGAASGSAIPAPTSFANGSATSTPTGAASGSAIPAPTSFANGSAISPTSATTPEFGPVAMLVLVIAVAGIIAFTSKTKGIPRL